MKNITVITDPGIDDLVALLLLYKLSPNKTNTIVSTFGNATEQLTARNAKEFITFVAQSWQFASGSKLPQAGKVECPWPDYFHGPDAVWGVHPDVDTSMVPTIKQQPNDNQVVSLAPMTDTLLALTKYKAKTFTIMGGAFEIPGNETDYAETNIAFDPDAAAQFFDVCRDVKVQVVPLDVTRQVFWSLEKVKSIPEVDPVSLWLKKLLLAWFDNYSHEREEDFNLHDPLAVYLHLFPEKAQWRSSGVKIEQAGVKRGQTTFSEKNPICKIATAVDGRSIAQDIFDLCFLS